MHRVGTLLRRWPRISAATGFCAAGTALAILWWTPVIFQARGLLPFVLFIGTPAVSAAVAGWTLGKPLLDPARVCTPRRAALRGAIIASFALLLFAPLFASLYIWTQAVTEHWSMLSLTFLVFIGSALTAWFKVALTGAAIGWVLYRLASMTRGRSSLGS
jgi:hypothetical protein